MTQDELKTLAGKAALDYVVEGSIVGVGTGSTVNKFIDALGGIKHRIRGAVSSSEASTVRLRSYGIEVFDPNEVEDIPVYIDGADEINKSGCMIKGGGGALTREKILAAQAHQFICVADESKLVDVLGFFPLPVEVIPMARAQIERRLQKMGATPQWRKGFVTDNGNHIIDARGLKIVDPADMEAIISQWAGVVTVGIFAAQRASVCLLARSHGLEVLRFD
ncbi:ribose-5-phosphate isomerase RpiA [Saezia sanguinis]|uniref:ribose-5-phosphate isomerase RpiA n=1 Tax=Saezia sanguinis TaxID=1965230 RepID=UPI00302168C7